MSTATDSSGLNTHMAGLSIHPDSQPVPSTSTSFEAATSTSPSSSPLNSVDPPSTSLSVPHFTSATLDDTDESANPWDDPITSSGPIHRLKTPDPSLLGKEIHGLEDEESVKNDEVDVEEQVRKAKRISEEIVAQAETGQWDSQSKRVSKEILAEFDPVGIDQGEDVWKDAEGRPPPPVPSKNEESATSLEPSTSTSPSFPSLAALARSFSIPKHRKLMSVDAATAVPSPRTLSGFATQQDSPPQPPPPVQSTPTTTDPTPPPPPPFDFQQFLDQMKSRPAEPVAKYLKSFLTNFSKRTFTVSDQIKIIHDFMDFISKQMREADVWRTEAEFDNAMEGMEKLVMNQVYVHTFTPAMRRGAVTTDDLERDRVLEQRIKLFAWIEPRHLDLHLGENAEGFLAFAQQELLKINSYKAPRDKLICILNCCKVIFGLIRHMESTSSSADEFLPLLIYVLIKSNPPNLISNLLFISRFRAPSKVSSGEGAYYLSSLESAVAWVEGLDAGGLNVEKEEFEKKVEEAIKEMEANGEGSPFISGHTPGSALSVPSTPTRSSTPNPLSRPFTPDALSLPAVERLLQKTGSAIGRMLSEVVDGVDGAFERAPASPQVNQSTRPGLRENAQVGQPRPNSYAGQGTPMLQTPANGGVGVPVYETPYKPRVRRVSPSPSFSSASGSMRNSGYGYEETPSRPERVRDRERELGEMYLAQFAGHAEQGRGVHGRSSSQPPPMPLSHPSTPTMPAPTSTLTPEETEAALETLLQIFPGMDREIVEMVLDANQGDVGRSVEGLLEMSVGN